MPSAARPAARPLDDGARPGLLLPAARTVRAHLPTYLLTVVLLQGVTGLVVVPLMVWLFDRALAVAGVPSFTHLDVVRVVSSPGAVLLLGRSS